MTEDHILFNDKTIKTDVNGFLQHLEDWNEELACFIAEKEQINLTDEHWLIINFIRDFYQEFNTSPAIRMLVKSLKITYGEEKGNSRYLQKLFPPQPALIACKIAGLPRPAKCL